MVQPAEAKVEWVADKKQWHVVITVGAEVIKRWLGKEPQGATDDSLRQLAIATAKDEGYDLDASRVAIAR